MNHPSHSSSPPLTAGAVRAIVANMGSGGGGGGKLVSPPVLQVINVKAVPSANGDRVRAMLSDGTHYITGMLASHILAGGGATLTTNCLVRLDDYVCNLVANRHVVILLNIAVLSESSNATTSDGKIGTPVDIEGALLKNTTGTSNTAGVAPPQPLYNSTNSSSSVAPMVLNNNTNNNGMIPHHSTSSSNIGSNKNNAYTTKPSSPGNPYGSHHGNTTNNNNSTEYHQQQQAAAAAAPIVRSTVASGATPIAALNMYNNRWTIQARLTVKSDIKTWSNPKGEGSLFSIELLDASGDIRATFFKEAVDKFYSMLTVGNVYAFTGGKLKVANMQYNTCQSQYEITFDQNAEIHLANDDGGIAKQSFAFIKLAALEGMAANKTVDVVAVVQSVADPVVLVSKKSGQELVKCDAVLVDDSHVQVNLTLWGDAARAAAQTLTGQPLVALGRARVSDYGGGVSLSAGPTLHILSNETDDDDAAAAVRQWWTQTKKNSGGAAGVPSSRSLSGGGGMGRMDAWSDRKSIAAIKQESLGHQADNKADYLSFKATVTFIKKDKEGGAWYTACANAGEPCRNRFKCTPTTDGQFFCEKCEQTFPTTVRRWIFSGVVEDGTSSTWVSFFNEQAETLLGGVTADVAYRDSFASGVFDPEPYNAVFTPALFSEWVFKCKVKNEFHNDESRVKTSVQSMHPVDYLVESRELLTVLEQF